MKLILSGEGATDLGAIQVGSNGESFVPGPMALIVDKLLEDHHTAYSLIGAHDSGGHCIVFVSKKELALFAKKGPTLLPGQKHGKGNAFFVSNAQCLGLYAKKLSEEEAGIPVIAILFRDGDGTNAKKEWFAKVESMRRGFELVEFRTGVPMVPNPKSEAWLICALRTPAYSDCASLEDESGNDNSPNPLKEQLARLCGGLHPSAETQADWIRDGRVDPSRIDMPSFSEFKEDLRKAARNAGFSDLHPSHDANR